MGEIIIPPLIPVEYYAENEGKLAASVRWLILRVYEQEKDIPDKLRNGVFRDEQGHLQLDVAVLTGMTNGSLYSQAAAKIFKEPHLVTQSHGAVLAALTDYGIDVVQRAEEGGLPISEAELLSADPFYVPAHLAMLDALMLAHLRNVITVDRVVEAVSRHTSVDDRERPMDPADALLFWINKICLLVRDDVERSLIRLKGGEDGGMIPEMEDLYDEISDGQCLCAMVHWYRPREMAIEEVCFNDQMSNSDCQYNLILLQQFCSTNLPWNPFHLEIEDILYLHDSMQMNINIFLADLFDVFEPAPIVPAQSELVQSPRRFIPIHSIPSLRAANSAARSPHPPRVRNPFNNVQVTQTPSRSMSMISQDSLLTNKTQDSLRVNLQRFPPEHWGANVTNFGKLHQADDGSTGNLSQAGQYTRSDSLPAASIRLALEEKRRDHEKKKAMQNTMSKTEREEKGKAAFFALMSRYDHQNAATDSPNTKLLKQLDRKLNDLEEKLSQMNMLPEQKISRALSQPSVYQEIPSMGSASARPGYSTLPHGLSSQQQPTYAQPYALQQDYYGYQQQQGQYAQPQTQLRSSLSNGMLNYQSGQIPHNQDYLGMGHGHVGMMQQQPFAHQETYGQMQFGQQSVATPHQPTFTLMHQSAHASAGFTLHQPSPSLIHVPTTTFASSQAYPRSSALDLDKSPSYTMTQHLHQQQVPSVMQSSHGAFPYQMQPEENFPPCGYDQQNGSATFRLHNQDASSSRLDPPLEINRNLTNWGLTYRQGHPGRPQRRTWENQTFIKSERDLVNQPDLVPTVPSEDDQKQRRSPSVVGSVQHKSRELHDETSGTIRTAVSDPDHGSIIIPSQSSPPRDPDSNITSNSHGSVTDRSNVAPGPAFIVSDDQMADDFDKIAEQRRQAKRAALLAKTMKRKEEIENKVDQIEQRNAERKLAEIAKRETADQRKIEKEIQRQKILDDYKRRKAEKEMGIEPGSNTPHAVSGRGHSQPPFIRTKSQMSESSKGGGSVTEKTRMARSRGQSTIEQRLSVQSLQEPTHKLFAKATPKSNRGLIINALQYSVFPGAVNDSTRMKTMNDLAGSDAKHFLILFRDHKCQYRGLYSWDQVSDTAIKISGQGPSKCAEAIMKLMFKYDSGAKNFSQIPTKHLGATIDGFSIQDQFWQKAKIPHSGAASHRNN